MIVIDVAVVWLNGIFVHNTSCARRVIIGRLNSSKVLQIVRPQIDERFSAREVCCFGEVIVRLRATMIDCNERAAIIWMQTRHLLPVVCAFSTIPILTLSLDKYESVISALASYVMRGTLALPERNVWLVDGLTNIQKKRDLKQRNISQMRRFFVLSLNQYGISSCCWMLDHDRWPTKSA